MVIDEKECSVKINALTQQDWQPLLALIPQIENIAKAGEWKGGEKNPDGSKSIPRFEAAPVVHKFLNTVYSIPIIINFDWGAWKEGRQIANKADFDFDTLFDTLDVVTKYKLITAIVRNDRFCEGALVSAFESGLILKILKSIEKEVIDKNRT